MNWHLTDKELSGYIHQTLTDAQRESMNRHLDSCPHCRQQIGEAKAVQRRIHYGLTVELNRTRPANMRFSQIAPSLSRQRRWARLRFYSMQTLSTVAILAVVLTFVTVIISFIQSSEWQATSSVPPFSTVLNQEWHDPNAYRPGLISGERNVVNQLDDAPIYHIELTIPEELDRVHGEQELLYTNRTGRPLDEIYFQLTPNLTNSQLTVSEVKVNEVPVTITADQTEKARLLRVPLQHTLLPNRQLTVYIAFELQMEPTRVALNGTLGFTDNVLTLANFHPTVAVYQNGKWQSEQPVHGIAAVPENSFYLVRLKTPGDLSVIASGVEIGRDMLNEYQIVTFAAGPIGQFYLTASNRYTVALSQMVGDTKVTSYAYAEHLTGQARTALGHAVAALENLNARYGIYPFTRLDIVGTPTMGVAKPVMAYPGVILIDLNKYDMVYAFGERSLESAVTFGVTQQWFGRIISSNRLKAPWLSESISEFVAQSVMTDLYGWEVTAKQRSNYLRSYAVPIGLSAYSYALGDYQATMYGRGPDFLYILSHKLGEDVGEKMLRDYYQSYKWDGGSLPSTESFQQLAEEHCTCDLEILFANWLELKE